MKDEFEITEPIAMRLAAISTAAMCNSEKTAKEQRITEDNPYWTVAYGDVCDAVDREMALQKKLEAAEAKLAKAVEALEKQRSFVTQVGIETHHTERYGLMLKANEIILETLAEIKGDSDEL